MRRRQYNRIVFMRVTNNYTTYTYYTLHTCMDMADMGHDEKAAARIANCTNRYYTATKYKLAGSMWFEWMRFFEKHFCKHNKPTYLRKSLHTASCIHTEPNKIKINPSTIFSMLNFKGKQRKSLYCDFQYLFILSIYNKIITKLTNL